MQLNLSHTSLQVQYSSPGITKDSQGIYLLKMKAVRRALGQRGGRLPKLWIKFLERTEASKDLEGREGLLGRKKGIKG